MNYIRVGKADGLDDIPTCLLKLSFTFIALTHFLHAFIYFILSLPKLRKVHVDPQVTDLLFEAGQSSTYFVTSLYKEK